MPRTDIVLAIHSKEPYINLPDVTECLTTLKKHTKDYRMIFVADDCNEEGVRFVNEEAKAWRDSLVIRTYFQHWFTRAYNLGLRMARTEWVVLLNSDVIVDDRWLDEMYEVAQEAEKTCGRVGLVGSVLSAEEPRRWAQTTNPGYVTGHCWLARMEALSDISCVRGTPGIYLDETQQSGIHINSDKTGCYELNARGWATIQSFKSAVGHKCFKSWGADLNKVFSVRLEDVSYNYAGPSF